MRLLQIQCSTAFPELRPQPAYPAIEVSLSGFPVPFLPADVRVREAPDIGTAFDVRFVTDDDAFRSCDFAVNVEDIFVRSGAAAKQEAIPLFLSAPVGQLRLDARLKRHLEAEVVVGGQDVRD